MIECFLCMDRGIVIIRDFAFKAVKWNKRIKGIPRKKYNKIDKSFEYIDPSTNERLEPEEVEEYDYCYEKAYRCICAEGDNFKNCKSIASIPFHNDIAKRNKEDYERIKLKGEYKCHTENMETEKQLSMV